MANIAHQLPDCHNPLWSRRCASLTTRRQAYLAARTLFVHSYRLMLARGGLDKLRPRERWQLRQRFMKTAHKADITDGVDGGADICRAITGSCDNLLLGLLDPAVVETIDNICAIIDERVAPPEPTDTVVVFVFSPAIDQRARIRESRPTFATTGPPPNSFRQLYHDQGTTAHRGRALYFFRDRV